jgi:Uma2 family endonuclease
MNDSSSNISTPARQRVPGQFSWQRCEKDPVLRRLQPDGLPICFGEEDLEMGESDLRTRTSDIIVYGVEFHLSHKPSLRVFSNLNTYYLETDPTAYFSPDCMVVEPSHSLPEPVTSYHIGKDGPAPLTAVEVLSFRTYQQGDLNFKPILYADLGIQEYLLVDTSGEMLPERLLCLRLRASGRWKAERDTDGGISSRLGFRFVIEPDGYLRVLDAKSGKRYARPREAQAAVDALEQLRSEIDRGRGDGPKHISGKRRRKQ